MDKMVRKHLLEKTRIVGKTDSKENMLKDTLCTEKQETTTSRKQ